METFLQAGDSEDDVALRFAELAEQLTPAIAPILVAAFNAHLRDSVQRGVLGRAELEAGDIAGAQELAVCFADLVGFTRLGGQVEVGELGTVAGRLAEPGGLADRAPGPPDQDHRRRGDVRQPRAGPAGRGRAGAGRAPSSSEELPSLRAGIAFGPALQRAGDYYGNSVNLASRVTGVARPGSVLCTQEVRDAAGDDGLQLVVGRPPPAQGRLGPDAALPRAAQRRRRHTGDPAEALGNAVQVDDEDERRVSRDLGLGGGAVAEARPG